MVHTFIFDGTRTGEGQRDFIRGLGVRFTRADARRGVRPARPLRRRRHTGCCARPSRASPDCAATRARPCRRRRSPGQKLPDPSTWDQRVTTPAAAHPRVGRLHAQPALRRRLRRSASAPRRATAGSRAGGGKRASGLGYVGGVERRVRVRAAGLLAAAPHAARHPRRADRRGRGHRSGCGRPRRAPMDLRFYHDGMGQDTYAEQLEGLEITYEDYEPGFGTPYGIARTTELTLLGAGGDADAPSGSPNMADAVRTPPLLVAPPEQLIAAGVFGGLYAESDRSTPAEGEDRGPARLPLRLTTRTRSSSAAGTASGTTATSCTPTTPTGTCGGTTSAGTRGTTPSCRRTCGCGTRSCAPAAPTSSASPRR